VRCDVLFHFTFMKVLLYNNISKNNYKLITYTINTADLASLDVEKRIHWEVKMK